MCAKSTFNFCLRDRAVLFAVIRNAVVNAFDNLARDGSYLAVSTPVNEREYIIFCDESEKKGAYFSNFYGGVRVGAKQLLPATNRLNALKQELGITSEVKWSKTDLTNGDRYRKIVTAFFDEIAAKRLVMRMMFTQNALTAKGLTAEHHSQAYYILYYQFLKHGFGLRHMPPHLTPPRLRVYLDEIGDTKEQLAKFRGFIAGLAQDVYIRKTGLTIAEEDITEVRSHDHVILQCLDVVLGSIAFRLNDKHLARDPNTRRKGNRTKAKEQLYKTVRAEIARVTGKTHFNVGSSTGLSVMPVGRWSDGYLHWLFRPSEFVYDAAKTKP
jgi:hypothetical protein